MNADPREKIKEALHAVTTYKRENFKEPEDAWRALAIAIGAHLNVIEDTLRNASQAATKPAGGEPEPIEGLSDAISNLQQWRTLSKSAKILLEAAEAYEALTRKENGG